MSRNITSEADPYISSTVCHVQELIVLEDDEISNEQRKVEVWKKQINYLENKTPDLEIPKLFAKLKLEEFEICNNLLYRVTELNNKDLSRKKVKQLVIPEKNCP